jgi:hypothetical protein
MLAPPLRLPCAGSCWHPKAVPACRSPPRSGVSASNQANNLLAGDAFLTTEGTRGSQRRCHGGSSRSALRQFFFSARCIMSVQSRHWLDYDPVALVALLVGMSAVALLALSI